MDILTLFALVAATFSLFTGVTATTFTIKNNCPYTIYPGILSGSGSASSSGFELASQASSTVDVSSPWSGRVFARFECSDDNGRLVCASADCGSGQAGCNGAGGAPPASLAEFTIASGGGQDFYDVSLVDGFNLPVTVAPQGGSGDCSTTACPVDINAVCPAELSVKDAAGGTIGCKSACVAFNQPQYCCTGSYGSPDTCKPSSYSEFFKKECPQAYSYAYDDSSSTYTCSGSPNYLITFCP